MAEQRSVATSQNLSREEKMYMAHVLDQNICVRIMKRSCDASESHIPIRFVLYCKSYLVFLAIDYVCGHWIGSDTKFETSRSGRHTTESVVFWKGCSDQNLRFGQVPGRCC
jgi:hypothetical protein